MTVIPCPHCGGEDVVMVEDGVWLCMDCVDEFTVSYSASELGENGARNRRKLTV